MTHFLVKIYFALIGMVVAHNFHGNSKKTTYIKGTLMQI